MTVGTADSDAEFDAAPAAQPALPDPRVPLDFLAPSRPDSLLVAAPIDAGLTSKMMTTSGCDAFDGAGLAGAAADADASCADRCPASVTVDGDVVSADDCSSSAARCAVSNVNGHHVHLLVSSASGAYLLLLSRCLKLPSPVLPLKCLGILSNVSARSGACRRARRPTAPSSAGDGETAVVVAMPASSSSASAASCAPREWMAVSKYCHRSISTTAQRNDAQSIGARQPLARSNGASSAGQPKCRLAGRRSRATHLDGDERFSTRGSGNYAKLHL